MGHFIVRVELHNASEENYKVLHESMASQKFARTIPGSDGRLYHLPPAEYYRIVDASAERISAIVEKAAEQTGREYRILVTEARAIYFENLRPVES